MGSRARVFSKMSDYTVATTVPAGYKVFLKRIAAEKGLTLAQLIREILVRFVDAYMEKNGLDFEEALNV